MFYSMARSVMLNGVETWTLGGDQVNTLMATFFRWTFGERTQGNQEKGTISKFSTEISTYTYYKTKSSAASVCLSTSDKLENYCTDFHVVFTNR